MKYAIFVLFCIFSLSCTDEKVIQLPEISHSDTNEVLDVSPAYLFYDETKQDSIEFNRKNIISTTNWLVNVDKRLTLEQVLPSLIILQNKRKNAQMHKNEAAKNYFTCNNISIKNLGFIEFTNVIYQNEQIVYEYLNSNDLKNTYDMWFSVNDIRFNNKSYNSLPEIIDTFQHNDFSIILSFDKDLSFQNYITYKSQLKETLPPGISINVNEFIY